MNPADTGKLNEAGPGGGDVTVRSCRRRSRLRAYHYSSLTTLLARVRRSIRRGDMARAGSLVDRYEQRLGRQDALSSVLRLMCLAHQEHARQVRIMVGRITVFLANDRALDAAAREQLLAVLASLRRQAHISGPVLEALMNVGERLRPAA